jgi:hypothetical protein
VAESLPAGHVRSSLFVIVRRVGRERVALSPKHFYIYVTAGEMNEMAKKKMNQGRKRTWNSWKFLLNNGTLVL